MIEGDSWINKNSIIAENQMSAVEYAQAEIKEQIENNLSMLNIAKS